MEETVKLASLIFSVNQSTYSVGVSLELNFVHDSKFEKGSQKQSLSNQFEFIQNTFFRVLQKITA